MGSRLSLCHYVDWQSTAWQLGRLVAILPFLVLLNSQTLRGEHRRSLVQQERNFEDNVMLPVFNVEKNERNYRSVRYTSIPGTASHMDDSQAFRK